MGKLKGKIALVTGGTKGIGFATAKQFVAEGAHVYITGRRQKELDEAVAAIGDNVVGIQGDVANTTDLDRLYAQIKKEKGTLDVVFANAGTGKFGSISEVTEEHFDELFNINVKGLLFTVQKALPLLKDGSSIILNASSVNGKGMENFSVYAATKAAVRSFVRSWTVDLKARKIRVNSISPGPVRTEIFAKVGFTEEQVDGFMADLSKQIPLGRAGDAGEIATAAVFLASSDSSYVTGIDLTVDGGMSQI